MKTKSSSNIDTAEIAKFEALATIWWDRQGKLKALHDINPLRLGYIRKRVALKGLRVLDVGCGGGILAEAMAACEAKVVGIDASDASIKAAHHHLLTSHLQIDYRCMTTDMLAQSDTEPFDVVTCMELLEHVPDPEAVVAACRLLTKPGGHVFFATINRNLKSFLFAILGAEYLLRLVAYGTHQYRRFIKPRDLRHWAKHNGLRTQDTTGLHYNPFVRRYSLGGNTHVNYLMHCRRIF